MTSTLNLGSKIPMSEVDGLTTAMSNKADTNLSNISGGGVNTCFRWLKPDLTRVVSIADGGSMPFDGWLYAQVGVWQPHSQSYSNKMQARVNGVTVAYCQVSWLQNGASSDYDSVWLPVKTGDVLSSSYNGDPASDRWLNAKLYPYEAAPEEEET